MDSQVARELADIRGLRGYARNVVAKDVPISQSTTAEEGVGMLEATVEAVKLWRRGRFKQVDGRAMPWLWPVAAVVRAAKRVGWQKGAASLRALVEGGWPLQYKLWVEGKAKHNRCKCQGAVRDAMS